MITPLAYRFSEAKIQQEAIVDNTVLRMTRRETVKWLRYIDMDERRFWTRSRNKSADQAIDKVCYACSTCNEDGLWKPTKERQAD